MQCRGGLNLHARVVEAGAAAKVGNPDSKAFEFTPNFAGEADAALLKRLEDWSQPFAAPLSQLGEVLESFKACVAEEVEEESGRAGRRCALGAS